MSDDINRSWTFRRSLQRELALWRREELIEPDQAERLTDRYALDALSQEAERRFLHTVFLIGAILVGLGMTAFVAANWVDMPTPVKVALLFSVMLAAHGTGYYFWKVRHTRELLGHALVLLGTLVFGANIGLMAQMFHLEPRSGAAFGVWALGALAMAYAVGSIPHLVLAIVVSFVSLTGWAVDHAGLAAWFPLGAIVAFLLLSYWKRSAIGFAASLVAVSASAVFVVARIDDGAMRSAVMTGVAFAAAAWAVHRLHGAANWNVDLGSVGAVVAVLSLCVWAYVLSFHGTARGIMDESLDVGALGTVWITVFVVIAVVSAVWSRFRRPSVGRDALLDAVVYGGSCVLLLVGVLVVGPVPATVLANIVLFAFGACFSPEDCGS
jgi:hypothetical protein